MLRILPLCGPARDVRPEDWKHHVCTGWTGTQNTENGTLQMGSSGGVLLAKNAPLQTGHAACPVLDPSAGHQYWLRRPLEQSP